MHPIFDFTDEEVGSDDDTYSIGSDELPNELVQFLLHLTIGLILLVLMICHS